MLFNNKLNDIFDIKRPRIVYHETPAIESPSPCKIEVEHQKTEVRHQENKFRYEAQAY